MAPTIVKDNRGTTPNSTATWWANITTTQTIGAGSTRNVNNHAAPNSTIPVSISANCSTGTGNTAITASAVSGTGIIVDNILASPMHVSVALASGAGGIGSTVSITKTADPGKAPDVANVTIDITQLNLTSPLNNQNTSWENVSIAFANLSTVAPVTVDETHFQSPVIRVMVTDTSGNLQPAVIDAMPALDARRPRVLDTTNLGDGLSSSIDPSNNTVALTFTYYGGSEENGTATTKDPDAPFTSFRMTLANITGLADPATATYRQIDCTPTSTAASGCALVTRSATQRLTTFRFYPAAGDAIGFSSNYRVNVTPVDAKGNVANFTRNWTRVTPDQPLIPYVNITATVTGAHNGYAGIGSTVTFTYRPDVHANVTYVQVDPRAFSSQAPIFWQGANLSAGSPSFALKVNQTTLAAGAPITIPIQATLVNGTDVLTGQFMDASGNPITLQVDPRAPDLPWGFSMTSRRDGLVDVTFARPNDTDLQQMYVNFTDVSGPAHAAQSAFCDNPSASSANVSCSWVSPGSPQGSLWCNQVDAYNVTCSWNSYADNSIWAAQASLVDAAGNVGLTAPSAANAVSTVTSQTPLSVSILPVGVSGTVGAFPVFNGTWSGPAFITSGAYANLSVGLKLPNGSYWTGGVYATGASAPWTPPGTSFYLPVKNNADGTWSADNLSIGSSNVTNANNAATLREGSYVLEVVIRDAPHSLSATNTLPFTLSFGTGVTIVSPPPTVSLLPALSGTWSGSTVTPGTFQNVSVALVLPNGSYWNGNAYAPGSPAPWTAPNVPFYLPVKANADGTWSADNLTGAAANLTHRANSATLREGTYFVEVNVADPQHGATQTMRSSAFALSFGDTVSLDASNPTSFAQWPVFTGHWSGAQVPKGGSSNLSIAIVNANGSYFRDNAGTMDWLAPGVENWFPVTNAADGTFTATNFNYVTNGATAGAAGALLPGTYVVRLNLSDIGHGLTNMTNLTVTRSLSVALTAADLPSPATFGAFPNLTGTWSGTTVTPNVQPQQGKSNLTVSVLFTGNGSYWNGRPYGPAAVQASRAYFPILNKGDGTWYANNFTTGGSNLTNALTLPSGNYTLSVQLNDTPHGLVTWVNRSFVVDASLPTINSAGSGWFDYLPQADPYLQGVTRLVVQIDANDTGTGLLAVGAHLANADNSNATGLSGPLSTTCPSAPGALVTCTLDVPLPSGSLAYRGNATLTFAGALAGDYHLNLTALDVAGNPARELQLTPVVHVRPRVAIGPDNPVVDTTNNMSLSVYAAIDRSAADGGNACTPANLCPVSQVQIFARTKGSGATGTLLATVAVPFGGANSRYGTDVPQMYDYTPNGRVSLGGFNRNNTEVQAVATATDPAGNVITGGSGWIQVSTTDQILTGLTILAPPDNATTIMPNAANLVNVSIRFDRPVASPKIEYWLNNTLSHSVVTTGFCAPTPNADGSASQGPTYFFNSTSCTALASHAGSGEYTLEVRALSGDGATFYKWAGRFFGLEQLGPVISISQSMQTDVVPGNFVPRVFNVSANVHTDHANLTASGVQLTLRGETTLPTDASVSLGSLVVTQDPATHVKDYNLTARVVLPAAAADGSRFSVTFNVSTDAYPTGGFAANTSQTSNFVLDLLPPSGNVSLADSQATVASGVSNAQILGVSSDTESGTKRVDVNLYDMDLDQTFTWDAGPGAPSGAWVAGDSGDFMTSDLVHVPGTPYYVRNVWLQQTGGVHNDQTVWRLNDSNRQIFSSSGATTGATFNPIGIDPGHLYRVRVRMVDALGQVSTAEATLRLDAQAPSLTTAFAVPGNGAIPGVGAQDWPVQANVTDNWCVGRVILHGLSPLTQTSESADFARPSAYSCVGHPGGASQWVLHMADSPQMRYEPGVWSYWLEVRDTAGNNVTTTPQSVYVQDSMAPLVRNVTLEPATVGEGSSTRIVADVLENWRVTNVSAVVTREGSSTVLASGALSPDPNDPPATNGTGRYLADIQSDFHLNLTLGNYVVTVKALDGNRSSAACPECAPLSATLRVVTEAPPDIRFDRPGDTATFVNASPSISVRVTGKNLTTSGVTIRAGTDANALSAVTPAMAFQPGSEGTVLLATFDEGALHAGDNLTVDVSVTTASGFSGHATRTWAVDATPPTVNASVTGDLVLNGVDWLGRSATITLQADDSLSGVAARTYSVNGGAQQTYRNPITVTPLDGPFVLTYGATDRAGNLAAPRTFTGTVDGTGPAMSVLQAGASVNVTVNDHGVGLDNASVRLYYRLAGGSTFANVAMQQVSGTSVFTATPPGDLSAGYAYYVASSDLLHNDNSDGTADSPHTVAASDGGGGSTNTPPTVKINAPANGDSARDSVEVQYLARDAETAADQLKVTISLRGVTTNQVLVTDGANDGSYTLNASGLPAGAYTLVVRASDGDLAGTDSVTFTIEAGPAVETVVPPPASVNADSPVNFAVKFNPTGKTVVQATWTAYKDGALYTSGVLTAGSGQYGAVFTPKDAGTYAIKVQATYNDGTTDPQPTQVAIFDVAAAPGGGGAAAGGAPASFLVLVGLAAATIALAGYGAFVRWRK